MSGFIPKSDRDKIWELFYSGLTPGEIAGEMNMTTAQIVSVLGLG